MAQVRTHECLLERNLYTVQDVWIEWIYHLLRQWHYHAFRCSYVVTKYFLSQFSHSPLRVLSKYCQSCIPTIMPNANCSVFATSKPFWLVLFWIKMSQKTSLFLSYCLHTIQYISAKYQTRKSPWVTASSSTVTAWVGHLLPYDSCTLLLYRAGRSCCQDITPFSSPQCTTSSQETCRAPGGELSQVQSSREISH